ncbi:UNVERIFIED_CONTAM: hypothetical protein K2H54_063330, partial [Gekko kuhli]
TPKPGLISWLQESEAPFSRDAEEKEQLAGHWQGEESYSERWAISFKMTSLEREEEPSRNPEQSKRQEESKAEKSVNHPQALVNSQESNKEEVLKRSVVNLTM